MTIKKRILPPSPNNASGDVSMNDFLDAFGVKQDPPAADPTSNPTEPPAGTEPDEGSSNAQSKVTSQPEGNSDPDPDPQTQPTTEPKNAKAENAFAQMRVLNKKYEHMFKGLSEILEVKGVDLNNPEAVLSAMQEKIIAAQAQKQNIPVEVLQELTTLKQEKQQFTSDQIRQSAYLGFQKIKDDFKLEDNELQAFADQLVEDGLNPFEQPVDLIREYRFRNFDKLVQQAEERGARREAERAAKAGQHSSTPNIKNGQGNTESEKITTVSGLTKWFEQNNK